MLAARLFGAQAWGQYIFLNAFFMPVLRLSNAGLDKGMVWFISRHQGRRVAPRFFSALRLRMCAFACLLLVGVAAYRLLVSGPANRSGLIEPVSLALMGLAVPFMVLTNLNIGVSIGFKKVEHDVLIRGICYPALQLGLPCLLALHWRGTRVLAASFLIGCVAGWLFSERLSAPFRRRLADNPADEPEADAKALRSLWNYSWPMGMRELVLSVQSRVDIWCLALFLDPKSLGVYGLALSIANSVKTVRQAFDSIMLAVISGMKRTADSLAIKKAYLHAGGLIIALQMPIFAFLVFFAPNLLGLSGSEYAAGEPVLRVFALALILNSYLGLAGMVVMGLGKTRWALVNDIAGLVLVVGLNLWWVPRFGIVGAAYGSSIAMLSISLAWFFEAAYLIRRIPLDFAVVFNFLGGVGLVAVCYFLWTRHGHPGLASRIPWFAVYAVLYGGFLLARFGLPWRRKHAA